jgi:hypothetical protein
MLSARWPVRWRVHRCDAKTCNNADEYVTMQVNRMFKQFMDRQEVIPMMSMIVTIQCRR